MEQNAFIEYDGQTSLYKLHNVLLDFLREKLANSNIDIIKLYHRTGRWFIEQGDELQAFDFYYKAGKIEELLERLNHPDMINISYLGYKLYQKIHSEMEKDLCIRYPFPFLQIACNLIISVEEQAVMQGVEIAKMMWEHFSVDEVMSQKLRNKILGELEVINIFLVFNDAQKMVEHSAKAYELLEGGISSIIFRNSEFVFGIPHFLYIYYREAGKLRDTRDIIVEGFPPSVFDGCGEGCGDLALAEYALETGDVHNAELHALKSIYRARTKMQIGIMICANFVLVRAGLIRGDFGQAKELLAETRGLLVQYRHEMMAQSNAIYNTTIDICEGYIYGCLKEPELIPEWLRNGDMSKGTFLMQGMAFPCIVIAKAAMLSGNWVQLEVLCESFKEGYGVLHNQLGLLHNSIYEAVAKYNLYGMEAGMDFLLPAIREAQADGILLPFAENADFILPILHSMREKEELDSVWIDSLIEICRQYSKNLRHQNQTEALLTRREAEVLELLAKGLTQKEIAENLYLSVSAVKRHLESMYIKLEANNKIAAIEKARSLNIL
jgi:LuxR family maltose regulon positive regulatory protein